MPDGATQNFIRRVEVLLQTYSNLSHCLGTELQRNRGQLSPHWCTPIIGLLQRCRYKTNTNYLNNTNNYYEIKFATLYSFC